MRIPDPHPLSLQTIRNRLGIEAHLGAHVDQREAGGVELFGLGDLACGHIARALLDPVASQDRDNRGAMELEGSSNVVHAATLFVRSHYLELFVGSAAALGDI